METGKGGPLPHTLTLHNRLDSYRVVFLCRYFFMMVVLPHIKH